jgi:hypothetical protein
MRLERYTLKANEDLMAFEFISEGPKGRITKWIQFTKSKNSNLYNLGFGDKIEGFDDIDDIVVTDNKDSQKVLATVAVTVLEFTEKYPDAWIFATGSTKSRTRLYQIGISQNLNELEQYFDIYGQNKGEWVKFEKNVPYEAFLVNRK